MKRLLQLFVMAALVASVGSNAAKHCVTKKNEHGVMVTTCHKDNTNKKHHRDHDINKTHRDHDREHNINRKRSCVTKIDANGKKVTTFKGTTVRKTH